MTTPIDSLYERFPLTFRRISRNEPFTLRGFECGDGWTEILVKFGEAAEPICAIDSDYIAEGSTMQLVGQIKEKFGGLRLYNGNFGWGSGYGSGPYSLLHEVVRECERLSFLTCEVCGEPGRRRGGGWIRTLCDTHAADHGKIGL